jgi:hypothetical protein
MNPFVQNIKLEVTKYIETRINEYQGMTNDEFYASKTQRSERIFFVDRVQRTSVYYVPDDMATMFHSDMTSAGRDMLYYIQRTLRKDMDYVTLDRKDACEQMNCSRGSLLSGLKQLAAAGIIAQKSTKEFWINPIHMFNGNRVEYFQDIKFTKMLSSVPK